MDNLEQLKQEAFKNPAVKDEYIALESEFSFIENCLKCLHSLDCLKLKSQKNWALPKVIFRDSKMAKTRLLRRS
jgi:hypothetical protein